MSENIKYTERQIIVAIITFDPRGKDILGICVKYILLKVMF